MVYLWRAVDAEGEVLDVLVQSKRNKHAALELMRKLMKKYAFVPERLVTDDLRSYSAAVQELLIERKAVKTAKGRKKVIAWLKMLENQSAQQGPEETAYAAI